jgi:hypothetical protein
MRESELIERLGKSDRCQVKEEVLDIAFSLSSELYVQLALYTAQARS